MWSIVVDMMKPNRIDLEKISQFKRADVKKKK